MLGTVAKLNVPFFGILQNFRVHVRGIQGVRVVAGFQYRPAARQLVHFPVWQLVQGCFVKVIPPFRSNALRVYVGYLRRKLEGAGARELIHTVRGVGYALREP